MEFALRSEFDKKHGIDTIEQELRDLMKDQGFGVLTEIDVKSVMKEKLDLDKAPYRILGFCNPPRANKVLDADGDIGIFLPCNGVIYESGDSIKVALTNAYEMFSMIENPEVEPIAKEVSEIFTKVKASLDKKFN